MIAFDTFWLFLITSVVLALSPGPDIIFVITQAVTKGFKAAISLSAGLCSGVVVHTLFAALGVSVVFQTSEIAFFILKIFGAMYLFYLAYQAFIHRYELVRLDKADKNRSINHVALFIRGFLMNVSNPKVIIFFLALFPQFVKEQNGKVWVQISQLGLIFMLSAFAVFAAVGYSAAKTSNSFMQNQKFALAANVATALIFFLIGVKLIFTEF